MTDNLKTWPERIWLQHGDDDGVPEFSGIWNSHGEIFWCKDSVEPHNVEYVRADLVKSDPAGSAEPKKGMEKPICYKLFRFKNPTYKITHADGEFKLSGLYEIIGLYDLNTDSPKCVIRRRATVDTDAPLKEEFKISFAWLSHLAEYIEADDGYLGSAGNYEQSAGSAGKVEPADESAEFFKWWHAHDCSGVGVARLAWDARAALSTQSTHQPDASKSVGNDMNVPTIYTPEELAEIEADSKAAAEAYSKPPCQECGAMTLEEAQNKCICNGDKDDCHGTKLWPD